VRAARRQEGEIRLELRTLALPIFAVAIVALIAVGIVSTLQRREAGRAHEANELVLQAAQEINRLGALEQEAIAEGRVGASFTREVERSRERVEDVASLLVHADPDGDQGDLAGPFQEFMAALNTELRLIRAGRLQDARALVTTKVDPAFAVLQETIAEEVEEHREIAQTQASRADRSSLFALLLSGIVIGMLALQFFSHRRAVARERRVAEELRELDRLKDSLLATVSHELKTPLTSITGYVELLRSGKAGSLSEQQDQMLEIVDRNSDRLLRLVGDLLFVASVKEGAISVELQEIDLAEVARESVEAALPQARNAQIELVLAAEERVVVKADRSRLGQLVDNLVSNALKFTPPGGRIDLRVLAVNGKAILEIADTGIGISPADREQIFEPFFRSEITYERAIQGAGLGLAIVKMIAEAHDATIQVESEEGAGTTFYVDFPRAKRGVTAPRQSAGAPS
jgi:signal transduction histidine kinase